MKRERIYQIIDWARDQGVQSFAPQSYMNPSSFHVKRLLNSSVNATEAVLDSVGRMLSEEPELETLFFRSMVVRGEGQPLRPRPLAEWLLAQALKHKSSEAAFTLLQSFVDGNLPPTLEVFALCGIVVYTEFDLPGNMKLVPFSSLPQSEMSDYFKRIPFWRSAELNFHLFPEPTAALVLKDRNGLQLRSDGAPLPPSDTAFREVVRYLTLVGPSAPTPVARWCQIEDWETIPLGGEFGRGPLFIEEVLPREIVPLPDADIRGTVERYLGLDQIARNRLSLPLQRLNLALKRQNKVDSAIELRVALEALLITQKGGKISATIQSRGAELLGKTPQERADIAQRLKAVYGTCSTAIHSGALDSEKDKEILRDGLRLCAELIRAIVDRGSIPKWS